MESKIRAFKEKKGKKQSK